MGVDTSRVRWPVAQAAIPYPLHMNLGTILPAHVPRGIVGGMPMTFDQPLFQVGSPKRGRGRDSRKRKARKCTACMASGSEERHVNAEFCKGRVWKRYCQYTVEGEI